MAGRPDRAGSRNLLRRNPGTPVYLVGASAFIAPSEEVEPFRLEALATFVRRLLGSAPLLRQCDAGPLDAARRFARNIDEIRFCVEDLIPHLRHLSGQPLQPPRESAEISDRLDDLQGRAGALQLQLDRPISAVGPGELLAKWLGAPCAILPNLAIPLEPVALPFPQRFCVRIQGTTYRFSLERARPLREALACARRAARLYAQRSLAANPALTRIAQGFVGDIESILTRYRTEDCGRYVLLHRDAYHQLQHRQGYSILVAGPLRMRIGKGTKYLGLAVQGGTREQRLALRPRPADSPDAFWTPAGEPMQGGLCCGDPRQFTRLLSPDLFSESEAFLQKLDSGAILGTLRAEFHRRFRKRRAPIDKVAARRNTKR
jgi:hypothetical protein